MSELVKIDNSLTDSAALMQIIGRAASDPTVDMDKMERLFKMHEAIVARNAEQEFNAAMSEAQSKMGRISVDAVNPQTRSHYASYAALDKALRPIYTAAGFALSFGTEEGAAADWARVVCHVSHKGGHSRMHHIDMPADGKGAKGGDVMTKTHATGAAMTYGMRYLLKLIFNVAIGEDDDDGNDPPTPNVAKAPRPAPTPYPDDKLTANLMVWGKLVAAGKTPAAIINTVRSKYTLTPEQEGRINALSKPQANVVDADWVADYDKKQEAAQ